MRLLEIIDSTFIGKLITRKQELMDRTDPDRIYVENIRSFFNIPTSVARFLCELAARQGLFRKKIGVLCENEECGRIILTVDDPGAIPSIVECKTCTLREAEKSEFNKEELQTIVFYQLVRDN